MKNLEDLKKYIEEDIKSVDFNDIDFVKQDIANSIELARVRRKLTQKQLAIKMKTSQSYISRIENGNSMPSLKLLNNLAIIFETKLIPPKFEFTEKTENTINVVGSINWNSKTIGSDISSFLSKDNDSLTEQKEFNYA